MDPLIQDVDTDDEENVLDEIKDLLLSMPTKSRAERKNDWNSMFDLIYQDFSPEQRRTIVVAILPLLSEEIGGDSYAFSVLYMLLAADQTLNFSGEEMNQILSYLESALTVVQFGEEPAGTRSDIFLCAKEIISKYMKHLGRHRSSMIRVFVQNCFNQVQEFDEIRSWLIDTVDKNILNDAIYLQLEEFKKNYGMIIVYLAILASFDWDLKLKEPCVGVESHIIQIMVGCDGNDYFKGDWLAHNQDKISFLLLTSFMIGSLQFEILHDCCAQFVVGLAVLVTTNGGDWKELEFGLQNNLKSRQSVECRGSLLVLDHISKTCGNGARNLKEFVEVLLPDVFEMFRTDALAAQTLKSMLRCEPNSVENRASRVTLIKKLATWIRGVGDPPIADIAMELNQIALKQNLHLIMENLLNFESLDPEHDPTFLEEMRALLLL